jgi:hypothetical protein
MVGIELLHMIKKKQMVLEAGDEGLTAAELFYSLVASSPHRQGQLPLHNHLSKICDTTLVPLDEISALKLTMPPYNYLPPKKLRRDIQ